MNNTKNVDIYDSSAWLEFRSPTKHSGSNGTTHLAKISDKTGKLHNCYVKLLNIGTPAMLCEAIGWILSNSSGVPCAPFACIVLIPIRELEKFVSVPEWAKTHDYYPAWCTEIVEGKSLAQMYRWEYWLHHKNCFKSKDVSAMAAMDLWADNKDRNDGNVIKSNSGRYISIDHEAMLHDLLWSLVNIKYEERSLFSTAKTKLSQDELKQFQIEIGMAARHHENGYDSAKLAIHEIVLKLFGQDSATLSPMIHSYLEPRAKSGWLANKIGVIV